MTRVMRGSHFVRCFISISSRRLRPISTLFPYTTLFRSSTKPNQELHGANHNPRVGGSSPSSGTREASCNSDPSHSPTASARSEEHTSELQSPDHLVCRPLLEKKKTKSNAMRLQPTNSSM